MAPGRAESNEGGAPITPDRLAQRMSEITESPTMAIDAKAKALKAAGENVIGFGAGEPDFPTPEHIVEAAARATHNSAYHRYTPAAGLPELRSAIASKTKRDSAYDVEAQQVVVSNGGKQALYNACMAIVDPGDEVILPAPYWVSYPDMIRLAGGTMVAVETTEATGFRATLDQLEKASSAKTKALMFTSPSNPTGSVYPPDEVEAIARWCHDHGIWIITDEIYEHLVFGDHSFSSMPVLVPEVADRCIVVNGVAKAYAMTGWRVGWSIAPPDVTKKMISLQSHTTSNVSNVAQVAALAAVSGDLDGARKMRAAFDRRRQTIVKLLNDIEGVDCYDPEGAFYAFPSVKALFGRTITGVTIESSLDLADVVLGEAKVAFVPGEGFGAPGYARFSYALGDDDLEEGIGRIARLLAST
ncbi:MAG: aminotransferase class I/II-fold pyridoxal phosphate-dependent enzyme [Actinobacteria bacterium]|nr:aminotransferase class I/II-fold pyridoxal phosphate-dependent enzyme [Actinomycetota bacterium]